MFVVLFNKFYGIFVSLVDCRWGNWGTWTECTKTCGGGTRQGVRKIEAEAKNGGVPCTGSTIRTATCNTQSCPGNEIAKLQNLLLIDIFDMSA